MNPTPSAMASLARQKCQPRTDESARLTDAQVAILLGDLPGWERVGAEIAKTFTFKNYYETLAFVNATAWISHREDHQPDIELGYSKCRIRYTTHSVGGLWENDFICAAKIEALLNL